MSAAEPAGTDFARHRHSYRVRFDEAGPDGLIRASALLRYAQDVAWIHSEALGFDRQWYAERAIAWLVRAVELELLAPVPMGAVVDLTTVVVGHRKVVARRRSEVRLAGTLAAWVHADWVLVDSRGAPARIPPDFDEVFPGPIATFQVARVDLPAVPSDAARRTFRVGQHEIDPHGHANNAAYVDWLEESIREAMTDADPHASGALARLPRRYRLEYAAAAGPADTLVAETWSNAAGWCSRLGLEDGTGILRSRLEG